MSCQASHYPTQSVLFFRSQRLVRVGTWPSRWMSQVWSCKEHGAKAWVSQRPMHRKDSGDGDRGQFSRASASLSQVCTTLRAPTNTEYVSKLKYEQTENLSQYATKGVSLMKKKTTIYVELEKDLNIIAQDSKKYWTVWTSWKECQVQPICPTPEHHVTWQYQRTWSLSCTCWGQCGHIDGLWEGQATYHLTSVPCDTHQRGMG